MASRPKQAEPRPAPRLYLVTPRLDDTSAFSAPLAAALGNADVAAVLLRLADADERTLIDRAKTLCTIAQDNDAALLLDGHADLVARAGADGAHLTGFAAFSAAIAQLKPDRIVGAGGLVTRHDAMTAAEAGADYVMFGEADVSGERPGLEAVADRVAWWAEVFEAPCVGFAEAIEEVAALVDAGADFIALGDWLWRDASATAGLLAEASRALRLPERAT
jgi:thiamine-phosphate pyrophosphorylase